LKYKRNCSEALARLQAFARRQTGDRILARMIVPNARLAAQLAADRRSGEVPYPDPDAVFDWWDAVLSVQAELDDDGLPAAVMCQFDQGIYAAGLGAPMRCQRNPDTGRISSMSEHTLKRVEDGAALRYDPENEWIRTFRDVAHRWAERAEGRFALAPIVTIDALNFVVEMRGAGQAYMDIALHPEACRQIMAFALEYNIALLDIQHEVFAHFDGGSVHANGTWAPGRGCYGSIDAYLLCSPETFEANGREFVQALYDRTGHTMLHIHSTGWNLLEAVCSLRRLGVLYLYEDPTGPRPFDHVSELKRRAGDVPLYVPCRWAEFCDGLKAHALPCGVMYEVRDAPSVAEANRVMTQVRHYTL